MVVTPRQTRADRRPAQHRHKKTADKHPLMKRGPFSARTGPETLKNEIKMNPKNNFKRCHKSDKKLTILRLN